MVQSWYHIKVFTFQRTDHVMDRAEEGIMSYRHLSQMGFINELKEVSYGPHRSRFCFI